MDVYTERTLAIIKPDAFSNADEIVTEIRSLGFSVVQSMDCRMSKEQCADFYIEHFGKHFYEKLVDFMSSGYSRVMVLSRQRAIGFWRKCMGPTDVNRARKEAPNSLRARYGTSGTKNAVHGSDSYVSAEREIHFFFPEIESATITQQVKQYLAAEVNPLLLKGLTELCKSQPEHPILWLADWLKANNPNLDENAPA